VLRLDRRHHRARLVRQYGQPARGLAGSQGDAQTLANGNIFTGWGALPSYSEFDASGHLLYDAHFHGSAESYRAYRNAWVGRPAQPPAIAVKAGTVYASWNGATEVASWQLLAGSSPTALQPVTTVPKAGFETAIPTNAPGPYFAVRALDASGSALGTSRAARP
jgi:hypothetical protein